MKQNEKKLSLRIAEVLKKLENTLDLVWRFDLAADMNLTIGQSAQHKRLQTEQRGYSDLFIAEPKKGFHGLYIELKNSKSDVYLKDGIRYKKAKKLIKRGKLIIGSYDHIQEQVKMHEKLRKKGYKVEWGFGYDDTLKKILEYLGV